MAILIPTNPLNIDEINETFACVLKLTSRTNIVRGIIDNALIINTNPITRITSTKIDSSKKEAISGEAKIKQCIKRN